MRLSVISFTENGKHLSQKIAEALKDLQIDTVLYTGRAECVQENGNPPVFSAQKPITAWTKAQMGERNALLFIGALGIAVRAAAPHLTDKLHDSPVLVMDEHGKFVIPVLSGHIGGANALALLLAQKMGAQPVITTATDSNGVFAVDLYAKSKGFRIGNKDGIAAVSGRVLAGKEITVSVETGHERPEEMRLPAQARMIPYPPACPVDIVITSESGTFDAALLLRPKEYVVGFGCRKGKTAEEIEAFLSDRLDALGISKAQIFALASISLKRSEPGILQWCRKADIAFLTYTARQLGEVNGDFHKSSFVESRTGVDNVCERAALLACTDGGRLIAHRYAADGMTFAAVKREWKA